MMWSTCFSADALAWFDEAHRDSGEAHQSYVKFRWYLEKVLEPHGNLAGGLTNIQGPLWEYRHSDYRMFLGWAPGRRIAVSDVVVKRKGRLKQSVYDHHERKVGDLIAAITEGRVTC